MRLSPKHVFAGIIAFGLPIALTTGWALGVPAPHRPMSPTGAGGIGTAPSAVSSVPVDGPPLSPRSAAPRPAPARTGDAVVVVVTSSASLPAESVPVGRPPGTVRPPRPTGSFAPPPVPTPTDPTPTPTAEPTDPAPTTDPSPSPNRR